jgi:hypothetical protein
MSVKILSRKETANKGGWIGIDLDGTLAEYHGWVHELHIGNPIPAMVERIKSWLAEGKAVKIFTARIAPMNGRDMSEVARAIELWCEEHIGQVLPIVYWKDHNMIELWDDRCVQVQRNTGIPVTELTLEKP